MEKTAKHQPAMEVVQATQQPLVVEIESRSEQSLVSELQTEVGKTAEKTVESVHETGAGSGSDTDVESASATVQNAPPGPPGPRGPPRGPPPKPQLPKWRLIVLIISLCFGLFLAMLDTSIIATALYTIGDEFRTLENVTWVALAYTLTYLGCCVVFTSVSDIVGRRDAYIAAFVIFFGFSLGCGFAQSLNQLIAFRALQGVGGAGLFAVSFVIFPEISPPALVKWIGGLAGALMAIAGILGPLLGGILTHYATWRWCFWINAPIGILPMIGFAIAWPRADEMAERRSYRELDFIGCVLVIAASVLTVFSFQQGGLGNDIWGTALFIAPLTAGCVCWFLLVGWEVTVARRWEDTIAAIFPLRLMKRRVYMAAMFSTMLIGFPTFTIIYSLPIRFQVVNSMSALTGGIGLLPMLGAAAVGSMAASLINFGRNLYSHLFIASSLLMLIGTGLLTTLGPSMDVEAKAYGFQILVGMAFGLNISTASKLAVFECQIRDFAVAAGIIAQVRILGGSIGIAAGTAILGVTQRRELTGVVTASQLESLQHSAATLSPEQLSQIRQAYSDSFREQMIVCTAVSAACLLVSLGTWQPNAPKPQDRRKEQIQEEIQRRTKMAIAKAQKKAAQAQAEAKAKAEAEAKA